MGMQAQMYAELVANEILGVIEKARKAEKSPEETLEAVEQTASDIAAEAKGGWY